MTTKSNILPYTLLFVLTCFISCSSPDTTSPLYKSTATKEYILRNHDEHVIQATTPSRNKRPSYPWEENFIGKNHRITKDFFRCKGSSSNPMKMLRNNAGDIERLSDCNGGLRHSLPLNKGNEFIFPVLIDILNHIQEKTGKRVVITSGHRCPQHNTYADDSVFNRTSKHMIGAEVDFYVQDMEQEPEKIIDLIFMFYEEHPFSDEAKSSLAFNRFPAEKTNVITPPWHNKELFIKLFLADEGRDLDNRHPYPYICLQVKYDRETKQSISYSWKQAFYNYRRE